MVGGRLAYIGNQHNLVTNYYFEENICKSLTQREKATLYKSKKLQEKYFASC